MVRIPLENLKRMLVESGLVKEADFESSQREAQRSGNDVADVLVSRGFITSEYWYQLLSGYYHAPLANLTGEELNTEVLNILPEDIARQRQAVVFGKQGERLKVAVADPGDLETIKFLE